jgi:hypothetical protein
MSESKQNVPQTTFSKRTPKTLRAWCEKNTDKVQDVDCGDGFDTDSGFAYDVMLRSGWCDSFNPTCHIIKEPTVRALLLRLRSVERCVCADCLKEAR